MNCSTVAAGTKRYLHGPGVDMVLAQENLSAPLADKNRVWWLLPDQLGSTRDVVNNQGEIVAHFQYDAYGLLLDGRENVTRYQFTGREHDSNTDYNYHRARWYDPASGKWLSEDPIGLAGGDVNLRRYVGNGPTNATDPSGLAKRRLPKGVKLDKHTWEFVLPGGNTVKIRNAQFVDSTVSLDDLLSYTDVDPKRIKRLRGRYKNKEVFVKFDGCGQPEFGDLVKFTAKVDNFTGSGYADRAWAQLKEKNLKLYKKLYPNKTDYVWHHTLKGELQLIDKDVHTAFQHTGLQSISRALGELSVKSLAIGAVFFIVPGSESVANGDVNSGAREFAISMTPLDNASFITTYFSWLYDTALNDVYGCDPYAETTE